MAPIFKKVGGELMNKAVFVKIDTNAQQELSSRYQIRSLPTFVWFTGDPKRPSQTEKGGIGEQRLRQFTQQAIRQAEFENVAIEDDVFVEYYQEKDPNKSVEDVKSLYQKCAKRIRGSQECLGGAATQLIRKLKKKYGSGPPTKKRFVPQEAGTSSSSGEGGSTSTADDTKKSRKTNSNKNNNKPKGGSSGTPNLHLATKEQLQAELEKRLDEERDAEVEAEDEDEEETDPAYKRWTPGPFPQPVRCI